MLWDILDLSEPWDARNYNDSEESGNGCLGMLLIVVFLPLIVIGYIFISVVSQDY